MPDQTRELVLLDELQAAEDAGAAALDGWIAGCQDPVLRGGLRVVRARDLGHAALARARLEELGGSPHATVVPRLGALCRLLGSSGTSDRMKLGLLLARFPEGTRDPFEGVLDIVEGDDETRALLDGVRDDDRLSLDWLHGIGQAPPVVPRERLGAAERANVVAFLGAIAAAMRGAADVAAAWALASPLPGLRGGLRAITARAAVHATLAGERLLELGGRPGATTLAAHTLAAARAWYGTAEITDEHKLARLLEPAGPSGAAVAAIETFAAGVTEDVETREILRLIGAGEAATMAWLAAYGRGAHVPEPAESARP
jgi:hypothetical protein